MLPVITSGVDSVALEKDEGTLAGVKGVAAVGATGLFQGFVFLDGARGMGEAEASKTTRGCIVGPTQHMSSIYGVTESRISIQCKGPTGAQQSGTAYQPYMMWRQEGRGIIQGACHGSCRVQVTSQV